jgi:hypothetical protein
MDQSRATKRECPLLVLSPRARSSDQLKEFRPFGGRSLVETLRDVATSVSRYSHRFDGHALFKEFLFGKLTVDESVAEALRAVPSSLVDCGIFRSDEANAEDAAREALACFAEGAPPGTKLIVLLCAHPSPENLGFDARRARSDDALFAYLWTDLSGGGFKHVGEVMAGWWSD